MLLVAQTKKNAAIVEELRCFYGKVLKALIASFPLHFSGASS